MAANEEFPRGWKYSIRVADGSVPQITLPAVAGVTHVLDDVHCFIWNNGATAYSANVHVSTSDNTYVNYVIIDPLVSGSIYTTDSDDITGLALSGGPGASLTVAAQAAPSMVINLLIKGHDV